MGLFHGTHRFLDGQDDEVRAGWSDKTARRPPVPSSAYPALKFQFLQRNFQFGPGQLIAAQTGNANRIKQPRRHGATSLPPTRKRILFFPNGPVRRTCADVGEGPEFRPDPKTTECYSPLPFRNAESLSIL
jgi:hypothetical protein